MLSLKKTQSFGPGFLNGNRSCKNSLIITDLKNFLPEEYREKYIDWLKNNIHWLLEDFKEAHSFKAKNWVSLNQNKIELNQWERIYLPRYWYGLYLKHEISQKLDFVVKKGLVVIEKIQGDVFDLVSSGTENKIFYIDKLTGKKEKLTAKAVVLAIGSLENKIIDEINENNNLILIQDPYIPNFEKTSSTILEALKGTKLLVNRNILIIGSNATSLELLFNLNGSIIKLVNKVYVISKSGEFPFLIEQNQEVITYKFKNLENLRLNKQLTADKIIKAAEKDIKEAKKNGKNIANIADQLSNEVINLVNVLSFEEQENFVSYHGLQLVRLIRRAGSEYINVLNDLIKRKKVRVVRGVYKTGEFKKQNRIEKANVCLVINCSGFENMETTELLLIRNLKKRGLIFSNKSGNGIEVDKQFCAKNSIYVMGPLLAGNINENIRLWHAESAARIHKLSISLASELMIKVQEDERIRRNVLQVIMS